MCQEGPGANHRASQKTGDVMPQPLPSSADETGDRLMAIVRGDRIGESQKLNRRPAEVGEWYALFVKTVPDDFGRFRVSPGAIAIRMHPRREPTPGLLKRVKRMLEHLGKGADPEDVLFWTWEQDGVVFAEMTNWANTGNRYLR